MASTRSAPLTGSRRSVSRVPGADPRCETPATTKPSARMTVHPVGRSASVWCPTRMPSTAVSVGLSERDARAGGHGRQQQHGHPASHLLPQIARRGNARDACRLRRRADDRRRPSTSAASAPMTVMSALPSHRPVASEKIVSPSPMVCDGLIARAYPSSAISAMRAPASSSASRWSRRRRSWCFRRHAAADRSRRARRILRASAKVPSGLRTPATTLPVAGSMMSPTALTATMAATMRPFGRTNGRAADARFHRRGRVRRTCRPSRPRRRRRSFGHRCGRRRLRRLVAAVSRRTHSSGFRRRRDRTGSPPGRSARSMAPAGQPMLCSSSQRTVPVAASRPNALPPARTIALTLSTMLSGLRRSVSRVPGAPPRCETPPTASPSTRITVQPVGRSVSVKWPTLMPGTAVSVALVSAARGSALRDRRNALRPGCATSDDGCDGQRQFALAVF